MRIAVRPCLGTLLLGLLECASIEVDWEALPREMRWGTSVDAEIALPFRVFVRCHGCQDFEVEFLADDCTVCDVCWLRGFLC